MMINMSPIIRREMRLRPRRAEYCSVVEFGRVVRSTAASPLSERSTVFQPRVIAPRVNVGAYRPRSHTRTTVKHRVAPCCSRRGLFKRMHRARVLHSRAPAELHSRAPNWDRMSPPRGNSIRRDTLPGGCVFDRTKVRRG